MYIQTITKLSFMLPDEMEAMQEFIKKNDMSGWKLHLSTVCATYTKTQNWKVDIGESKND